VTILLPFTILTDEEVEVKLPPPFMGSPNDDMAEEKLQNIKVQNTVWHTTKQRKLRNKLY